MLRKEGRQGLRTKVLGFVDGKMLEGEGQWSHSSQKPSSAVTVKCSERGTATEPDCGGPW